MKSLQGVIRDLHDSLVNEEPSTGPRPTAILLTGEPPCLPALEVAYSAIADRSPVPVLLDPSMLTVPDYVDERCRVVVALSSDSQFRHSAYDSELRERGVSPIQVTCQLAAEDPDSDIAALLAFPLLLEACRDLLPDFSRDSWVPAVNSTISGFESELSDPSSAVSESIGLLSTILADDAIELVADPPSSVGLARAWTHLRPWPPMSTSTLPLGSHINLNGMTNIALVAISDTSSSHTRPAELQNALNAARSTGASVVSVTSTGDGVVARRFSTALVIAYATFSARQRQRSLPKT